MNIKKLPKKPKLMKITGFAKMSKRLRRHVDDSLDREFGPAARDPYNTRL